MADGGRMVIRTENLEHPDDDDVPPGRYAVVTVADSGCGIAPDVLPRVFDPFFTTKDTGKGSGLGLSMVYGFVKQTGGHVRIRSEPGHGTMVKLYLPPTEAAPAPPPAASPADAGLPRARAGETILVVEDNEGVRRYCVGALESIGYRVLQARDALDALEVLDSAAGLHLLFTDIVLPGGMTGPKLADVVRERRGPALPVLYASGYAGAAAGPEVAGAQARLLHKPYSLENLAVSVRRALDAGAWPPSA
jgi:CheY-like chemotaxis protein